jgi:hypothetical protein
VYFIAQIVAAKVAHWRDMGVHDSAFGKFYCVFQAWRERFGAWNESAVKIGANERIHTKTQFRDLVHTQNSHIQSISN